MEGFRLRNRQLTELLPQMQLAHTGRKPALNAVFRADTQLWQVVQPRIGGRLPSLSRSDRIDG